MEKLVLAELLSSPKSRSSPCLKVIQKLTIALESRGKAQVILGGEAMALAWPSIHEEGWKQPQNGKSKGEAANVCCRWGESLNQTLSMTGSANFKIQALKLGRWKERET